MKKREARQARDLSGAAAAGKSMIRFPEGSRVFRGLQALAPGGPTPEGLSKRKFFAEIWGRQAYAPRLHDTLISSLLHRMKKESSLSVRVRGGGIPLDDGARIVPL